jgi:2-phospho-L-lactate guanylyltransferase
VPYRARPPGEVLPYSVASVQWTVLVPVRALPAAKSRLAAEVPPAWHAELVRAIRADSLDAVRATPQVARLVIVADRPGVDGAEHMLVQHSPGLNGALRDGARLATRRWPGDGVAALVGDVPALRSDELSAALDQAAAIGSGYVADTAGTGTTLLAAAPGHRFVPAFGVDSAARHERRAAPLTAGPGLRQDVDTLADLLAAARLGLGERTATVIADAGLLAGSPAVHPDGARCWP